MDVSVGVLTVSDTCSTEEAEDTSGPELKALVEQKLGKVWESKCVPDNIQDIRSVLVSWADTRSVDVILTTGGTGFAPRDVTPEATRSVIDKEAPGLVHAMLAGSLKVTPLAALSRPAAGIRGKTIIVNFPGSKKAVKECFGFVQPVLVHAVDLLKGRKASVKSTHNQLQGLTFPVHACPHHSTSSGGNQTELGGVAGRPRESPYPMISVQEAQEIVLNHCKALLSQEEKVPCLGTECLEFSSTVGRILVEDVLAKDPLPPFPASIKDGYAVIAKDGAGVRDVRGESSAGRDPDMPALSSGEIVRINTGAPVPDGADAVVMVENTKLIQANSEGEEVKVEILVAPVPGLDIRPVGSDIYEGERVMSAGNLIGPGEVGVLAAVGATQIKVAKLPRVALLSTGNEIQPPGEILKPGHVRDSNKTTLKALLQENGFPVIDAGIAKDNLATLTEHVRGALQQADLLVTTGGVSMGDRDLLRQVLVTDFAAEIHFARVNMKPGKPTTFATCVLDGRKKLILGLPGNPVSATVTCHLYVLPACRTLAGQPRPLPGVVRAKLQCPVPVRLDPRPEYQRVWLRFEKDNSVGVAVATGNQISSRVTSVARANGLIILPGKSEQRQEIPKDCQEEFDVLLTGNIVQ